MPNAPTIHLAVGQLATGRFQQILLMRRVPVRHQIRAAEGRQEDASQNVSARCICGEYNIAKLRTFQLENTQCVHKNRSVRHVPPINQVLVSVIQITISQCRVIRCCKNGEKRCDVTHFLHRIDRREFQIATAMLLQHGEDGEYQLVFVHGHEVHLCAVDHGGHDRSRFGGADTTGDSVVWNHVSLDHFRRSKISFCFSQGFVSGRVCQYSIIDIDIKSESCIIL